MGHKNAKKIQYQVKEKPSKVDRWLKINHLTTITVVVVVWSGTQTQIRPVRFHSSTYKWGLASSTNCECSATEQTADHVISSCLLQVTVKTAVKVVQMGRSRNFIGSKHFRYEENKTTCRVEGCQYKYKRKSGLDVHATPLVGHLKRKYPNLYSKPSKKNRKKAEGV